MTSKERVRAVFEGRQPDRLPICPVFNGDYVIKAAGLPREKWDAWDLMSNAEIMSVFGGCHRRHPEIDLIVCTTGSSRTPAPPRPHISKVSAPLDIPKLLPAPQTVNEVLASGIYDYLPGMVSQYGQETFLAFVTVMPLATTVNIFGGYEDGLVAMLTQRAAFEQTYLRLCENLIPRMRAAASLGMEAVWFTQFWAGCDTISPELYRELVLPGEKMLFEEARRLGLKTFFWFLGDLARILPDIMQNKPGILILEPGRKGYTVDLGQIRAIAGPAAVLSAFPDETAMRSNDHAAISAGLRAQLAQGGSGPMIITTPILMADVACETVDFLIEEVKRIPAGSAAFGT
jgi:uroporphyrinogen-III decarboxylase